MGDHVHMDSANGATSGHARSRRSANVRGHAGS
jgi:hypothetical protein